MHVYFTPRARAALLRMAQRWQQKARHPEVFEVDISILDADGDALVSHARVRLAVDLENLHHAVQLPAGQYAVVVEMRGREPRRGTFEVPAEGVVRVHWSAAP